jgi:hypothetical protein
VQLGDAGDGRRGLPRTEQHREPFGVRAPCDQRQRIQGLRVERLDVVDDAQHWMIGRYGRENVEQRQADHEAVSERTPVQPERRAGRVDVRPTHLVQSFLERLEETLETGETLTDLVVGAGHGHRFEVTRSPGGVVEQRRLADAGLTTQHQRAAHPGPRCADKPVQRPLLI